MLQADQDQLPPIDDPNSVRLAVPMYGQGQFSNLCWAVCCEMVLAALGEPTDLCDLVTLGLSSACPNPDGTIANPANVACCPNCTAVGCDQAHWPNAVYQRYGIQPGFVEDALTFGQITYEINAGRPINAALLWNGGTSHLVVVAGYYFNGDVLINDPGRGQMRRSYEYLKAAYNLGRWSASIYNLGPSQ
jgi:hypothetical protein